LSILPDGLPLKKRIVALMIFEKLSRCKFDDATAKKIIKYNPCTTPKTSTAKIIPE
jgi:hypothetical protein